MADRGRAKGRAAVMRWVLVMVLMAVATPVAAAGWGHYLNARYGYGLDVPPGFEAKGESDNGDGQVFSRPGATLTVFGGTVSAADFEAEVMRREQIAERDGWAITYQVSTPARASFSARQGARILYTRMIALCGGGQFAAFELSYGAASVAAFNPVIDRLVASLGAAEGSCR